MSLSNLEVEYLCKYLKVNLIACCLQEDLKNMELTMGGYVINYGTQNNGGTHYVALYYDGDYVFCFDSFGAPFDTDVLKFIENVKHKAYNPLIIQDLDDDHCGFYCVAFLNYVERGFNELIYDDKRNLFLRTNTFLSFFREENNLSILKSMFKKWIKPQDIKYFNKTLISKIL